MNQFGWIYRPEEVLRFTASLPMPVFEVAAPHLKGTSQGRDVFFWEAEQQVLGKVLPAWGQLGIGSCVAHGWGRGVQDLLLIQILLPGSNEGWEGTEVAREPIYGGSRVQVGGERSGEGSIGAWAARWIKEWGILLYGVPGLEGYYDENRCRQYGSQGVPQALQEMSRLHPVKTVSAVMTAQGVADAVANLYPVPICGQTSRTEKRVPGGWCPKTGNIWPHCEEICGCCLVRGGSRSPWGGDGAAPWSGDTPALVERNSWLDYLGSENADVSLASGKTITLPMGCYLSRYEEREGDLRQGDTFAISGAIGFAAQTIPWTF